MCEMDGDCAREAARECTREAAAEEAAVEGECRRELRWRKGEETEDPKVVEVAAEWPAEVVPP